MAQEPGRPRATCPVDGGHIRRQSSGQQEDDRTKPGCKSAGALLTASHRGVVCTRSTFGALLAPTVTQLQQLLPRASCSDRAGTTNSPALWIERELMPCGGGPLLPMGRADPRRASRCGLSLSGYPDTENVAERSAKRPCTSWPGMPDASWSVGKPPAQGDSSKVKPVTRPGVLLRRAEAWGSPRPLGSKACRREEGGGGGEAASAWMVKAKG